MPHLAMFINVEPTDQKRPWPRTKLPKSRTLLTCCHEPTCCTPCADSLDWCRCSCRSIAWHWRSRRPL